MPLLLPVIPPGKTSKKPAAVIRKTLRATLSLPLNIRMALNPEYPWLPFGAVRRLAGLLGPTASCWEWGSGRSSLYMARRAHSLVTVEHKNRWRKITSAMLSERELSNVELLFIPESVKDAGKVCGEDGLEYAEYADAILKEPDESLDVILVDGRARVRCVKNSISKLRPGGELILDNSERERYASCFKQLSGWTLKRFSNGVQQTSFFRKPGEEA